MDFYTLIMAVVAVYVARPAFTGKGKLMQLDFIKEGKEKIAKKGLRICYLVMFFMSLVLMAVSLLQSKGFKTLYSVTFTEDFTSAAGVSYSKDQNVVLEYEDYAALYNAPEAPAEADETTENETASEPDASESKPAEETKNVQEAQNSASNSAANSFSCFGGAASDTSRVSVPCTVSAVYEANEKVSWLPGADSNAKYSFVRLLSLIAMGISFADIIFLMVFTNKVTDKEARKKAQAGQGGRQGRGRNYRPAMPKDAFSFEEEPTEKNGEE